MELKSKASSINEIWYCFSWKIWRLKGIVFWRFLRNYNTRHQKLNEIILRFQNISDYRQELCYSYILIYILKKWQLYVYYCHLFNRAICYSFFFKLLLMKPIYNRNLAKFLDSNYIVLFYYVSYQKYSHKGHREILISRVWMKPFTWLYFHIPNLI